MINLSNALKKKNNKKGFTLIELIVVIAILAILAAIAIPRLTGFQAKAKVNADEAVLNTLISTVEIGVADGKIVAGTLVYTQSSEAAGTWSGTAANVTAIENLLASPVVLKAPKHVDGTATVLTWTIDANGVVSLAKTDW